MRNSHDRAAERARARTDAWIYRTINHPLPTHQPTPHQVSDALQRISEVPELAQLLTEVPAGGVAEARRLLKEWGQQGRPLVFVNAKIDTTSEHLLTALWSRRGTAPDQMAPRPLEEGYRLIAVMCFMHGPHWVCFTARNS